jgi:hypothetical protein
MTWHSIREKLPRRWKWVYVKAHVYEENSYKAYRTLFGYWKFQSGIILKIHQSNLWSEDNTIWFKKK